MPFRTFKRLSIPDIVLIEAEKHVDARGFFTELYKRTIYWANNVYIDIVQVNMSYSRRGVVRGLHYQLRPMEQGKLFTVVKGKVYAVAVDIRRGSPWYGKYVSTILSEDEPKLLWVPPGFAFGFQALDDSIVVYLVTKEYSPEHERGIIWNDPDIGIDWPIRDNVILSEKDKKWPPLRQAETNFEYL